MLASVLISNKRFVYYLSCRILYKQLILAGLNVNYTGLIEIILAVPVACITYANQMHSELAGNILPW